MAPSKPVIAARNWWSRCSSLWDPKAPSGLYWGRITSGSRRSLISFECTLSAWALGRLHFDRVSWYISAPAWRFVGMRRSNHSWWGAGRSHRYVTSSGWRRWRSSAAVFSVLCCGSFRLIHRRLCIRCSGTCAFLKMSPHVTRLTEP